MANTFNFGTDGNWAVKEDYALAYNSENGNFKPLPFDFTRASSATRVNKNGLVETVPSGKPRIDFLNNTSGHLLLEPSRTNISPDSERMDLWSSLRTTETINSGVSPDGANTAVKVAMTSDTGEHSVYDGVSVTSGTAYTNSIFIKRGTGSADWQYFQFRFRNGGFGTGGGVVVDIHNGTITYNSGLTDYGIENYGNGWYRVFITQTATNTSSSAGPVLAFNEIANGYDVSIVGNTNADVLLWGSQFEAGSYATSYIPTEGSSVTRSAETANGAGNSNVFNDSEGVLYAEIAALANDGTSRRISISAGNTNNNNLVSLIYGTSNKISPSIYSGGGFQMGGDFTLSDQTDTIKVALKYSLNDAALWVNGVEVLTDNSVTPPVGLDQIKFEYGNGSNDFYGKCKDLRVYDTALSDSDLQALTSN